jgi:hypothetical protein
MEGRRNRERKERAGRRGAYPAPRERRRVLACGRRGSGEGEGEGAARIGDGGREPSRVWLVDAGVVAGWGGNGDEARRDEAGGRARDQSRDGRRPRRRRRKPTSDRVGFGLALASWAAIPRWSIAFRVWWGWDGACVPARAWIGWERGARDREILELFFIFTFVYFFSRNYVNLG